MKFFALFFMVCLTFLTIMVNAETYRSEGLYEITLSRDWKVQSKAEGVMLMDKAAKFAAEHNEILPVHPRDLATPFMAKKSYGVQEFELRITTTAADQNSVNFAKIPDADFQIFKDEQMQKINKFAEISKSQLLSTDIKRSKFKGYPALRMETLVQLPSGSKYLRLSYTVYQPSASLIFSISQMTNEKKTSFQNLEAELTAITVLAK